MGEAYTVKIYMVNGDPEGLRTLEDETGINNKPKLAPQAPRYAYLKDFKNAKDLSDIFK